MSGSSSERPFSETEKVVLLAEIIKWSDIPASALYQLIDRYQVEPAWPEITLPSGRKLPACQKALREMQGVQTAPQPTFGYDPAGYPPRQPYTEAIQTAIGPRLVPRPPNQEYGAHTGAMPAFARSPSTAEPPRKRGRPSNADLEARRQRAEARGEAYVPPPSRARKPKPRISTTPTDAMTPVGPAPVSGEQQQQFLQQPPPPYQLQQQQQQQQTQPQVQPPSSTQPQSQPQPRRGSGTGVTISPPHLGGASSSYVARSSPALSHGSQGSKRMRSPNPENQERGQAAAGGGTSTPRSVEASSRGPRWPSAATAPSPWGEQSSQAPPGPASHPHPQSQPQPRTRTLPPPESSMQRSAPNVSRGEYSRSPPR